MGSSDIETYNEKGLAPASPDRGVPTLENEHEKKGDLWVDDVKVVAADDHDLENAAHK